MHSAQQSNPVLKYMWLCYFQEEEAVTVLRMHIHAHTQSSLGSQLQFLGA